MAPVGPQLPASMLDKRKRDDDDNAGSDSSSDSSTGPAPLDQAQDTVSKRVRVIGPSIPPPEVTAPPATVSDEESDTSDDDDFGPSLPTANAKSLPKITASSTSSLNIPPTSVAAPKRDDWMMVPPTGGDWTGRVDPTKLKNRKFNTGKSAKGPSSAVGGATDSWHETPQEKQARLQREMMGIKDTPEKSVSLSRTSENIDPETAKRLQEYNKSRGPSLYEAHQSSKQVEKDDDPSARAFDREKDIGGGLQINATQRRDMLKKAADFKSRFSSAKYL